MCLAKRVIGNICSVMHCWGGGGWRNISTRSVMKRTGLLLRWFQDEALHTFPLEAHHSTRSMAMGVRCYFHLVQHTAHLSLSSFKTLPMPVFFAHDFLHTTDLWGHTAKHSDLYDDFTQAVWLSHKVIERFVCCVLVSVTNATGQMEGVYNLGDFVRCFQAALKAFQMYPHSYALPHMLLHDYFEKYIIVKKFCFHCIMHELVIFILRIVFISTS